MIVATAGHVDHGKTALVKALTGIDTDRLPEEKARGISIDLGFAYTPTPAGATLGFVDVPGHERFVRTMIAGVCAIDYALLVVAADDGVMPQTREHLAIVDLLGVAQGLVVISKVDCVSRERVCAVRAEVAALVEGTGLAGAEMVETSTRTGTGIDALRQRLLAAADAHAVRHAEHRRLRYAVDRAFSVAGSGTVVTGTVFQGAVTRGDRLVLAPSGAEVRVRGIQKAGLPIDTAHAGERCALNLTGIERERVARGQWLLAEDVTTTRIDVRLRVLANAPAIEHWTPVHLHIGTADVPARVAIAGGSSVASGTTGIVQLICAAPISAVVGDRFIVRDPSAMQTQGGGVVVDPFPPSRKRSKSLRMAQLAAMETFSPENALPALLSVSEAGVDLETFGRAFNLEPAYRDRLARECRAAIVGDSPPLALPDAAVERIRGGITVALAQFHAEAPQAKGLELAALRRLVAPALRADTFAALVRAYAPQMNVEVVGSVVRRTGHVTTANRSDQMLWERVEPALLHAGYRGVPLRDLAQDLRVGEAALADFLHRKSATGEVIRVTAERFYPRRVLAQLAALATYLAAQAADGSFVAAVFRDHAGVNRTIAIEILEALDRLGITQRVGDARKIRNAFAPVLGDAPAPTANPRAAGPASPRPVQRSDRVDRRPHSRS